MKYLTVEGSRLAYRVDGPATAPALVLINSLGTDLHMWDQQVPALSGSLRVVRYDCRGHGRSELSALPLSIELLGRDLLALLDELGIARAHLCGLSLGGMVALWTAARHAERAERVVLANTAARIGTVEGWDARIALVQSGGMAAVRDVVLARFLSPGFQARRPAIAQQIAAMLEGISPEGYIAACLALRDADLLPLAPLLRVPALIIAGASDESTPPGQAEELHAAIPDSRLVVLQSAHLSNVEQPESFNQALLGFLR